MFAPRSTSKPSENAVGQSVISEGMPAGTPESPTGSKEGTPAAPPGSGWHRWSLSLALMVSLMVGFYDRNNITFALTDIAREMSWPEGEAAARGGALMSAFYITYGLANILLSPLANRHLGARKSLLLMTVMFSVITALTPSAGHLIGRFLFMRFLLGLAEGIHYPMMATVTRRWFPPHERSRGTGIYSAGSALSGVTAPLLLIPLKEWLGWQKMFLVLSVLGAMVTLPILHRYVFDRPSEHPRLSAAERRYLELHLAGEDERGARLGLASVRVLFSTPGFATAIVTGVFAAMSAIGLMSWLPTYLEKARGLSPEALAPVLAVGVLCAVLGMAVFAWLSDRSPRRIRVTSAALLGCALATCLLAVVTDRTSMFVLLCLAMFLLGAYPANEWAVMQRILPADQMTFGSGVYNGITTLMGGGLGPALIGGIISYSGQYSYGILMLAAFLVGASGVYFLLSRSLRY